MRNQLTLLFFFILLTGCVSVQPIPPVKPKPALPKFAAVTNAPVPGVLFKASAVQQPLLFHRCTNCPPKPPYNYWSGTNYTPGIFQLINTQTNCYIWASCSPSFGAYSPTLTLQKCTSLWQWQDYLCAPVTNAIIEFTDTNETAVGLYRVLEDCTLNVTNFGGTGDAWNYTFNTSSNSVIINSTNLFGSNVVGQVAEIFRCGPWITYNGAVVVTQQDLICLVTNIYEGTNLSLSLPAGVTGTFIGTVGTENSHAFQAAINLASSLVSTHKVRRVNIRIPQGQYLLLSPNILDPNYVMTSISDTHPALTIQTGGIRFLGEGNPVLLGSGAGMEHRVSQDLSWIEPGYAPYVPMRDTLIECRGPVANNQYPLVFQNITLDGGVQQGQQAYNYWTLIQANGAGWDTTHHAVADWDGIVTYQMNQMKVFTNCVFQHWRGEILICWTGPVTNAMNDIANCTFIDGNATADNMYYGQHVHGCLFSGLGKVMEYYQGNATMPAMFENNVWTNIAPNNNYALTIVGAVTTIPPQPFTIQNNAFHDELGINAIQFSPACNVSVISNSFVGGNGGLIFTSAGAQPSDGTAVVVMTNFTIMANSFNCGNPLGMDGYPVSGVVISNNSGISVSIAAGYKDSIILNGNTGGPLACGPSVNQAGIQQGHYPMDSTNNLWGYLNDPLDGGSYAKTNLLSIGNGYSHLLRASGSFFFLDDTKPDLMQSNSMIQVFAATWSGQNCTNFYVSAASPGQSMTITNGAPPVTFHWNGINWHKG